jgi:hypothetical protein
MWKHTAKAKNADLESTLQNKIRGDVIYQKPNLSIFKTRLNSVESNRQASQLPRLLQVFHCFDLGQVTEYLQLSRSNQSTN